MIHQMVVALILYKGLKVYFWEWHDLQKQQKPLLVLLRALTFHSVKLDNVMACQSYQYLELYNFL